jgi:glycosyltransferase involved in cell wall biosynthesis
MSPKVIHLVISLAPGGLERLVVDWTNARNKRFPGSTSICCLDSLGDLASQVDGKAVCCVNANRARWPFDGAAVRRIRGVIRQISNAEPGNPQERIVLHSHNAAAWQYGVIACFATRVRHIHTEHGTNPHYAGVVNHLRNAWLWRLTPGIAAVAGPVADALADKQSIPRGRISVIPNGIAVRPEEEPGHRDSAVRAQLGLQPSDRVLGSVGRLSHVKGYDRLITAFNKTPSGWILLLVGDGPERDALVRQATELGLVDRVIFAGYQANPRPYYRALDMFVLPSRSEGLSISLLEAMAAGVPVAVTDAGSNREVIDDGKFGTMLPEDEGAWAVKLEGVLNDTTGTQSKAAAARTRVHDTYSQETTLDKYEQLYVAAADLP